MHRLVSCSIVILCLFSTAWAADQSRSYVYTAEVTQSECGILPQPPFELLPALSRAGSKDRLIITCSRTEDGHILLQMKFLLTDAPPALGRGESRSYSFRWGAQLPHEHPPAGEFTRDELTCERVLTFLTARAGASDSNLGPPWTGGCYRESQSGMAMEITLTERSR